MRSSCLVACFALLQAFTAAHPEVACNENLKINWFHLQEDEVQWQYRMPTVLEEWKRIADTVEARFPDSKFGAASFRDVTRHYKISANFSDKESANKGLIEGPLGSYPAKILMPWPETDEGLRQYNYTALYNEVEAPLEPLIWTALHAKWDSGNDVVKIITVNQQSPAHFSGDTSRQGNEQGQYPPFDKDTYPSTERSIWPSFETPRLSIYSDYASLEYTRTVLAEHNIHLIVNYGAIDTKTSRDPWRYVMTELGFDYEKYLHYLPGSIKMYDNVLKSMEIATDCSWDATTTSTTTTRDPNAPCDKDLRINWFHLQEEEVQWQNRMPLVLEEWKLIADAVETSFPKSKFGAAAFRDITRHYMIQANFSDKASALKSMNEGLIGTYPTRLSLAWPETDEGLRQYNYTTLYNEVEAPLEPLIWTALHADWDSGNDVVKIITINQQSPAHYAGDGSRQANEQAEYAPFDTDTYPITAPSIWPSSERPRLSIFSNYATLELTRKILAEHKIHLIVNYGATDTKTSREPWKYVMEELGFDSEQHLHYLTGSIKMHDNVLKSMKSTTSCAWSF